MLTQKVFNFMRWRHLAMAVSIILCLGSLGSLAIQGLNFGLDFTGGTSVALRYSEPPNLEDIRNVLDEAGYPNAVVVHYGSERDISIRLQTDNSNIENSAELNIGESMAQLLRDETGADISLQSSDVVGANVGEELANDGGLGLLAALALIFLYVAQRFQTKFSVAALGGLTHDVIIVLGFFSVFQLNFDLTVLAAVLAVIGYSLNDSIVVSDRIRENFRIMREESLIEITNVSLTQTLGRTLMTSGTTLVVLLALFFVGGELIRNFSIALILGVVTGTYSSIYIGSALLLMTNLTKEDLMPPVKEGEELEELP